MPDPAIPTADGSDALRLVLFGPPGAGKSSLLGALSQAANLHPHLLNGRIADPSPNFSDLRARVYDYGPPAPQEEVVPYSFEYEPVGGQRRRAVVNDSDGQAADVLIHDPAPAAGALADEMLAADALVLTVDASAPPDQLDAHFADFDRFLHRMEQHRGTRTDAGGLPVFLVLTKCDRLARPGETTADWLEQIEERKRVIGARFREFLAARHAPPAFGRIHLHLWATAVRRPPLVGATANPTDPYGVAELFRQCLDQAAAYREWRERSAHQLVQMTLATAGGVLVLLAAAALLVVTDAVRRPPSELEIKVERLRRNEPETLQQRLHGSLEYLRSEIVEWRDIHDAPDFASLPAGLRAYVKDRLSELETYVPWLDKLEETPRPREALSEDQLQEIEKKLAGPLAPPHPGWDDTDAGRMWTEMLEDARALLKAIKDLRTWYQQAADQGDARWTFAGNVAAAPDWDGWVREVNKLLDAAMKPPFTDTEEIPGVKPALTYAFAQGFGSVASARERWEAVRGRLRRLRDVGAALGLIDQVKDKPPLLIAPATGLTLAEAADRWSRLKTAYPDHDAIFTEGRALPPAVAAEIRARAQRSYERLLEPARALVLHKLHEAPSGDAVAPDRETRERWQPVREWLKDPKELVGWRELTWTLARLADPAAADPVKDLASFLDNDAFSIDIRKATLVLPDALGIAPRPGEPLKVYRTPAGGGAAMELALRPIGDGLRVDARPWREYSFTSMQPDRKLDYSPGDGFYALLPLTDRKALRWEGGRSRLYRFEGLHEAPVLEGDPPTGDGKVLEEIRLRLLPEGGAPGVPDLMPLVDLK
jgi:hypothetical protein